MKLIKIRQCTDSQMWYSNKVGVSFLLVHAFSSEYVVKEPSGYTNTVQKQDAEVIEDGNTGFYSRNTRG